MKREVLIVVVCLVAFAVRDVGNAPPAAARVHDEEICWDPDVEFPVPCDSDED